MVYVRVVGVVCRSCRGCRVVVVVGHLSTNAQSRLPGNW